MCTGSGWRRRRASNGGETTSRRCARSISTRSDRGRRSIASRCCRSERRDGALVTSGRSMLRPYCANPSWISCPGTPCSCWSGRRVGAGGGSVLRVLTDHEIFRRARRLRRPRRYREAVASAATRALRGGDFVVHLEHGIGIYRGIQTIAVGADGGSLEVAVVEYEGGARLNVPLYRLDQLEPYRAAGDGEAPPPRLHRLGATTWQRQRDKARAAIHRMASELLHPQPPRQLAPGFAFPPDTPWQRELESAFLYEDTPDQRRASEEVKRDMERAQPMDRLLVGDVGYGKTEVALRAAFKAVQAGQPGGAGVPRPA